ncbi:MAG: PD-(D/E)XK nuclease family protein [Planctomycetota bacterium]
MNTSVLDVDVPCHATRATDPPALEHLSWSSASTYCQCPKKFELQKLLRVEPTFVPAALVFGQSVHQAIEAVQESRLQGVVLPAVKQLMDVYMVAWKSNTTTVPTVQYAKDEDELSLRTLAERMLTAYRQHVAESVDDGAVVYAIEHEARFKLHPLLPDIVARIDLIEMRGNNLVLTDYKTSRGKWNDSKANASENLGQLMIYAYAARPLLKELGADRLVPRFVILSKLKTTTIQIVEPTATQADAQRVKDQFLEVYSAIRAGIFVPRTGWHCSQCPFKSRCPAFS